MAAPYTTLFRKLNFDIRFDPAITDGSVDWEFRTDRPGTTGALNRVTGSIAFSAAQSNVRRSIDVDDFSGTVRGRQFQLQVSPIAQSRPGTGRVLLYGVSVYAKVLDPHRTNGWQWYRLPVVPTADDWTEIALPIPPTPDDWSEVPLPIPPTADGWSEVPIPMRSTELQPSWIEIPVDQ